MKFIIHQASVGSTLQLEISEDDFVQLHRARRILSNALSIEENYEVLISNYLSLETTLLSISVTGYLRNRRTYLDDFDRKSMLNVALVNLLMAARLYLDHLPQRIAECLPGMSPEKCRLKKMISNEYDTHFEYRFMEALRNYSQHRGIPVHGFGTGYRWDSIEKNRLEINTSFVAAKSFLEQDDNFKKKILQEMPDKVNLTYACRRYVESLSAIHQFSRDQTSESVTRSRELIEDYHRRYAELSSDGTLALIASRLGDPSEKVPLLLDWDDVRIDLQQRNLQLKNLGRSYVTGRIPED